MRDKIEIKADKVAFEYIRRDEDGNVAEIVRALDDVSVEIKKGTFLAVLGHNGCGKSTFARHLNVLLMPSEGTLWINGMDTKEADLTLPIRKETGMVFQNPDNQIIGTMVEEDVAFGLENIGVETGEIWNRVGESLKKLGIEKLRLLSPNRLSGGQKQKVAIAGIMAMQPGCIVLDEATSMLDPKGRLEVLEAMRELNRREKITVILITHYMEEALYADQAIVMEQGKLVMAGTPREIFSQEEKLEELHLEVPAVTEIANRLRRAGLPVEKGIVTKEELVQAVKKVAMLPGEEKNRVMERVEEYLEREKEVLLEKEKELSKKKKKLSEKEKELSEEKVILSEKKEDENVFEEAFQQQKKITEGQNKKIWNRIFSDKKNKEKEKLLSESGNIKFEEEVNFMREKLPILILDQVCYTYQKEAENRKNAVDRISLSIHQGEFLALLGHTGSGKSTLLQLMNGLLKATEGKIYYRGQDISDKNFSMKELRSHVGLVFQYPEYQLFETTVVKDVMFGPKNQGLSLLQAQMNTFEALKLTGIGEELFDVSPFSLSGGQKRRVAIAGVLAMKPDLMILDEPAAGLDPQSKKELFDMLENIHEQTGMAVLIVSHSMEDAAEYAKRILVMKQGRILFDDTPEKVFLQEEELRAAGLDIPVPTQIQKMLQKEGLAGKRAVYTKEQLVEEIVRGLEKD